MFRSRAQSKSHPSQCSGRGAIIQSRSTTFPHLLCSRKCKELVSSRLDRLSVRCHSHGGLAVLATSTSSGAPAGLDGHDPPSRRASRARSETRPVSQNLGTGERLPWNQVGRSRSWSGTVAKRSSHASSLSGPFCLVPSSGDGSPRRQAAPHHSSSGRNRPYHGHSRVSRLGKPDCRTSADATALPDRTKARHCSTVAGIEPRLPVSAASPPTRLPSLRILMDGQGPAVLCLSVPFSPASISDLLRCPLGADTLNAGPTRAPVRCVSGSARSALVHSPQPARAGLRCDFPRAHCLLAGGHVVCGKLCRGHPPLLSRSVRKLPHLSPRRPTPICPVYGRY